MMKSIRSGRISRIIEDFMKQLVADGEELTIVGVVQPAEGSNAASLNAGIAYPKSLTKHVAEESAKSEIVKQQLAKSIRKCLYQ